MQRIVIIGTSCSGKTTLAAALAGRLNYPHIQLDALHWLENWTERPASEFRAMVDAATDAPNWVVDGNYSKVKDITWRKATTLIWLNYAFPLVFKRALIRTVRRSVTGEALYSGNRETFRKSFFSKESILWWVITTHRRRKERYRPVFDGSDFQHLQKIELRTPAETQSFLKKINMIHAGF